ncbi:MAG TPA: endonuclease domain-containing protein [Rhodanobacteraceae bacterium]|nr:endonuclease domain-containing protein [Rhodanobacteraceae bacterium]
MLRDRRLLGIKFRRQHRLGRFIVDFIAVEQRLIIKVDGSQHLDSVADELRTQYLQALGFRVLRFWNDDVLARREQVLHSIALALQAPHPP